MFLRGGVSNPRDHHAAASLENSLLVTHLLTYLLLNVLRQNGAVIL